MSAEFDLLEEMLRHSPEMLFVAGDDGTILQVSDELMRALGIDRTERPKLASLVHADDRTRLDNLWAQPGDAPVSQRASLRFRVAGGSYRLFSCGIRRTAEGGRVYGSLRLGVASEQAEMRSQILQAIVDNLSICVWAIDETGIFTYHDGKGLELGGLRRGQHLGLNLYELYPYEEGARAIRAARAGQLTHSYNEHNGVYWEHWYLPVYGKTGEVESIAGVSLNISEQKSAERELRAKLELIEKQQQVIRSLSTPIIQVWDGVLTLPMLGVVDSIRASDVMDSLLREVVRTRARYAILDLTGVDAMDTATAGHLLGLIRAIKLLGADGIITGLQPSIAQTMVGLDVDMSGIVTLATLQDALKLCMRRVGNPAR